MQHIISDWAVVGLYAHLASQIFVCRNHLLSLKISRDHFHIIISRNDAYKKVTRVQEPVSYLGSSGEGE